MSIITEAMRDGAKKEYFASKHDDGTFSAHEYVSHSTPSGCERWLPTYSDNRKWPTKEQAIAELRTTLEGSTP